MSAIIATVNTAEIAGTDQIDAQKVLADVAVVLSSAFRDLIDADDSNRRDRYDRLEQADSIAMHCAHALHEKHRTQAKAIQDIRMAVTLAGIGYSPSSIALEKSRKGHGCKTYIAINPDSGLMKIGRSVDPYARMDSLKTGAAVRPEILLLINEDKERALHKQFAYLRVFGEWFRDDGSISTFIDEHKSSLLKGGAA